MLSRKHLRPALFRFKLKFQEDSKDASVYSLVVGKGGQSRMDNGEVLVRSADGASERPALANPVNWWPIEQHYPIDDLQFHRPEPIPPRVDLATGAIRMPEIGKERKIHGRAATVIYVPLDPAKELKSLTLRTPANEVAIGTL